MKLYVPEGVGVYESPQGFGTWPDGGTARGAVGRGHQAKHDSVAPTNPWGSALTFVTMKTGGSRQLSPLPQGQRPKELTTEHPPPQPRAILVQGPRGGLPPVQVRGRKAKETAQQRNSRRVLPKETGPTWTQAPGQWPSGQAWGERTEQEGVPFLKNTMPADQDPIGWECPRALTGSGGLVTFQ